MISRVKITILTVVILTIGFSIPSVHGQAVFVTVPLPNVSARNQVIDFYAGGTSDGYSLRASPQGAALSINGVGTITMMPWGYVTAQWSLGPVYIIFLANVTQTDFRIGFLYLTNSTNEAFILRWFDYNSGGTITSWTFQGAQHVFNRTVSTIPTEMPKLQIPAAPKITNAISALGPELYLTPKGGQMYNSTTRLNIYPLVNQLFGGSTDYNEVWSLLADQTGDFYFAILYMQNNNPSQVIVEHQLRLNDYKRLDGRTVQAKWMKGSFSNQVTVRAGQPNLTVKIDGFPFQTNERGLVSLPVPNGRVSIQVPADIQDSDNSKISFYSWNKFGSTNPLTLLLNSSLDIYANYTQEYSLTVTSPFGTAIGAGWYPLGANASFGVENQIDRGNGTRIVFQKWQGDSNSTFNQTSTIMNSAKQVTALWKQQYRVNILPIGLPSNASAQIMVGESIVTLNGTAPYTTWVDAYTPLAINIQTTQIQQSTTSYVYAGMRVGGSNQPVTGDLTITKPLDVLVIFTGIPKDSVNVQLAVSPTVASPGYPLNISGFVQSPSKTSSSVSLLYSLNNVNWQQIADVSVAPDGTFSYVYPFAQPGDYYLKASLLGDANSMSASPTVNVRIVDSALPTSGSFESLAQLLRETMGWFSELPYASTLLSIAGGLMILGRTLTSYLIPGGGLPILGDMVGSLLVGFVFVFPVSASIGTVRAIASHHRPSLLWLTPMTATWLVSIGLLTTSLFYSAAQPFQSVAELSLIISNIFLIPIATSLTLARVVS